MRYVIIGGSIASVGAIEGIRKFDREGSITVISDEPDPYYSRPLISYYLAGKIDRAGLYYRKPEFYQRNRVQVITGKACNLAPDGVVTLESGEKISYDKLLLAVGGTPLLYDRLAAGRDNVVGFYTLEDVERIRLQVMPGIRVAVIGAGLVGLKAAEALYYLNAKPTVVDLAPYPLSGILDPVGGEMVERHLRSKGVECKLGMEVSSLEGTPRVKEVVFTDGSHLDCDMVIIAAGVRPNLALAAGTGIDTGQGILVDEHQETSIPSVYAAGDVAQAQELLSGDKKVVPILPLAWEQGRIAGMNMAGHEAVYRGSLAVNSVSLLDMAIMTAGDSRAEGLCAVGDNPPYYRKIVLQDGGVTGLIAINHVDNMGIITGMIRKRVRIEGHESLLLQPRLNGVDVRSCLPTAITGL